MPTTHHLSVAVWEYLSLGYKPINHISTRRPSTLSLRHIATTSERSMCTINTIVICLRVGTLVARCTLYHRRQPTRGTLRPSLSACSLSPVIDSLQTRRPRGRPLGHSSVGRGRLPWTRLFQGSGSTWTYQRVAFSKAVCISRMALAVVGTSGVCRKVATPARSRADRNPHHLRPRIGPTPSRFATDAKACRNCVERSP